MPEMTKRIPCRLCSTTVLVHAASVAEHGYCVPCGDRLYDKAKELEHTIEQARMQEGDPDA
jgi:hypothetical protein